MRGGDNPRPKMEDDMKRNWTIFTGVFVALLLMSMVVYAQYSGPTHNISPQVITVPTEAPTGVPALAIDQSGLGVFLNLTKDGGTPVANLTKGGTLTVGTTVDNGAIAEDLTVTGVVTATGFVGPLTGGVTGDVLGNVTGNLTGTIASAVFTPITVACPNGAAMPVFTTGNVITLTATGANTPNDWTVGPAGKMVIIIGPPTNSCVFTKGAKMALSAATVTLGPNDTLLLVSDGTSWNEVAFVAGATS